MNHTRSLALSVLLMFGLSAGEASAVSIGLTDTFEDGTTQGWRINLLGLGDDLFQPVNVPTGGPAGVNDNFMLMTSSGQPGAGGRLVALNFLQWSGNYTAAGISSIQMDVNNLGATDLYLRLLFEDPMGAPPENEAFTPAVFLPAGSGWTPISFSILASNLIVEAGSAELALSNATILRLFSNPNDGGPDEAAPILARLGVDNITAAVPEPASLGLVVVGLVTLVGRRWFSRH